MDATSVDAGVILASRTNINSTHGQKALQLWLPSELETSQAQDEHADDEDDEEHERAEDEHVGVGSTTAENGDVSLDDLRRYQSHLPRDKLLDQLLGKKAAQAHKKPQQHVPVGRGVVTPKQPSARQRVNVYQDESEDEGEGRASAFSSRKSHNHDTAKPSGKVIGKDEDLDSAVEGPASPPSKKRAGNNYLDELLAQRMKKKSKKKKGPS